MSIAVLNTDSTRSPISEDRLAALVEAQRAALHAWGAPSVAERLGALRRLDEMFVRYSPDILRAIEADFIARSVVETWLYDIRPVRGTLRRHLRRLRFTAALGRIARTPSIARVEDGHVSGITGLVTAWHFPVAQSMVPLADAIAAGNRVILALPHQTAETSSLIKRMIGDVFPADHVVAVSGSEFVATAFARLPLDRLYASAPWPQARSASLAAGSGLIPLSLAVQGRGAAVVTRGYSLDIAAQQIIRAKLFNAGQHPSAPDVVYLPRGTVDIFLGYARHAVAAMYPTLMENPDYGSLVSERHADFVRFLVEDAIDRGAQAIRVNPGGESFTAQLRKIVPTLVVEVSDEMAVLRQPILGPVLAVRAYHDLAEVVEQSTHDTGLGSVCWFDNDAERANAMMPRLSSRRAWFNGAPPFGSVLSTVLPPLWTGDVGLRLFDRISLTREFRNPIHSSLVDGTALLTPPYGGPLRALAALKLGI